MLGHFPVLHDSCVHKARQMSMMNAAELSLITGKSRAFIAPRMANLKYEVGPRKTRLYDSREALAEIYKEKVKKGTSLVEVQTELTAKRIEKIDFDLEVQRGGLLPYQDMLALVRRIFTAFRTRLLSIPTKSAPELAKESDPIAVQELLEGHVLEALEEIANLETFVSDYDAKTPVEGGGANSKTARAVKRQRVGRQTS